MLSYLYAHHINACSCVAQKLKLAALEEQRQRVLTNEAALAKTLMETRRQWETLNALKQLAEQVFDKTEIDGLVDTALGSSISYGSPMLRDIHRLKDQPQGSPDVCGSSRSESSNFHEHAAVKCENEVKDTRDRARKRKRVDQACLPGRVNTTTPAFGACESGIALEPTLQRSRLIGYEVGAKVWVKYDSEVSRSEVQATIQLSYNTRTGLQRSCRYSMTTVI
jgi:hypothetical protein